MRNFLMPVGALGVVACAGVALACGGDAVACKDAKRIEATQLLSDPPSGYEVVKRPESEARKLLDEFPKATRDDISGITLAVANKSDKPVVVYAITSAKERLDPEKELKDFRESAQAKPEELDVGGEKGLMQTVADGSLAIGTAGDCGAVLLISEDKAAIREVAKTVKAPKD